MADYSHVIILLAVFLISYFFAIKIKRNKNLYTFYLTLILAILSYFKYGDYIVTAIRKYIENPNPFTIVMPLGISFFTFLSISYVSDVYYEKYSYETNPLYLLSYLSFFPIVVSGPLMRYDAFSAYLNSEQKIHIDSIANGLRRFIIGLGKKVIIANQINNISSTIINSSNELSLALSWLAIIGYGIQEYYDFSGYSDMAIGIGKMINITIPENFNNPYFSHSISEYWRKWHMSLGSFIRDYIYIPLGGNRKGSKRKAVNIIVVFFLSGIWHGSTVAFLVWGLFNGALVAGESLFSNYSRLKELFKINSHSRLWRGFQIFRTSIIAMYLKVFAFKCPDNLHINKLFRGSIGLGASFSMRLIRTLDVLYSLPFLLIGIILIIPKINLAIVNMKESSPILYDLMLTSIVMLSIVLMISGSYTPFIYFKF